MALAHFDAVCRDLDTRHERVMAELHVTLQLRVRQLQNGLTGRLALYCGFRGPHEQQQALASGASMAAFGQSPHNFRPSLAVDLVLDPRAVQVRENPDPRYPGFPDLWDNESSEALHAWNDLEIVAQQLGLERVDVNGQRDRPHVQLPHWRDLI